MQRMMLLLSFPYIVSLAVTGAQERLAALDTINDQKFEDSVKTPAAEKSLKQLQNLVQRETG